MTDEVERQKMKRPRGKKRAKKSGESQQNDSGQGSSVEIMDSDVLERVSNVKLVQARSEDGVVDDVDVTRETGNETPKDGEIMETEALGAAVEEGDGTDSEGELEALAVSSLPSRVVKLAINNEQAILQKLEEISIFSNGKLPFLESLSVPNSSKQLEDFSANLAVDDLTRETRFAECATEAVQAGLRMLRSEKIKFRRPGDYFAEMVKSDSHMQKVKSRLLAQKDSVSAAQRRRRERSSKKHAKEVQIVKEQEQRSRTKREIESVASFQKERLRRRSESGKRTLINEDGTILEGESDEDFPIDLLDVEEVDASMYVKGGSSKPGRRWGQKGSSKNRSQLHKTRGHSSYLTSPLRSRSKSAGGISKTRKGSKKRLGKTRRAMTRVKAQSRL